MKKPIGRRIFTTLALAAIFTFGLLLIGGDSFGTTQVITSCALPDCTVTDSSSKVTFTWTPPAGIEGYEMKLDGVRVSNSWDKTLTGTSFSKKSGQHVYEPDALVIGIEAPVTIPAPTTSTTTTTTPAAGQVFVSPAGNDSTCARGGSPCQTFDHAYAIAQPGDTVVAQCGHYSGFDPAAPQTSGPNVVFMPVAPYCATLGGPGERGLFFRDGPNGTERGSFTTWQNFVMPDGVAQNGTNPLVGLVLDRNRIGVDVPNDFGQGISLHTAQGVQITNNTIGPWCCSSGSSSPEGIRVGFTSGNSTGLTITGNLIQAPLRTCAYWPATYELDGQTLPAGVCPGSDCGGCHDDAIHVWGVTNSTVASNRIVGAEVQGIYFENSNGPAGLSNANNTITGNTVSLVTGSAAIYVEGNGTQPLTSGAWTIGGNTTGNLIEIGPASGMAQGTTFSVTGNQAGLLLADSSGNAVSCTGLGPKVVVSFSSNIWAQVGGGTNGCG